MTKKKQGKRGEKHTIKPVNQAAAEWPADTSEEILVNQAIARLSAGLAEEKQVNQATAQPATNTPAAPKADASVAGKWAIATILIALAGYLVKQLIPAAGPVVANDSVPRTSDTLASTGSVSSAATSAGGYIWQVVYRELSTSTNTPGKNCAAMEERIW